MTTKTPTLLITVFLLCFRFLPEMKAVNPPPDGGYPGLNTAEGTNALKNLTSGVGNAAVGWYSLFTNSSGSYNTGVGAGTLALNNGEENTAIGAGALLLNTTGDGNTANGALALLNNTTGDSNTATGASALFSNTTATGNTANGFQALSANTTASDNTAVGSTALLHSTIGSNNTGIGSAALRSNTTGGDNTATGGGALLSNTNGVGNTAYGARSLWINTTGDSNTALGVEAGLNLTGSGNVCIGERVQGTTDASDTTWIRNVYASVATARAVFVNSDNKIGTMSSSRRFKEEIRPMDQASDVIFALKPVSFRYKEEIDRSHALSFGLIAEEVAEISPELITRDTDGRPQTVRYEAVNAMLLNEFLKEHQTVQEQGATIAELKKEIAGLVATVKEQAAQIQKVNARLEVHDSAQVTANEL
jgi:endosialidase-like protein